MADEWTDISRGANDDVIPKDVRCRGEKLTRIVNVYDQRDSQSGKRPAQQLNWQRVIRQGGAVLAGHFNAHTTTWDLRRQWQWNEALWDEVIDEHAVEIGNDSQSTHHWMREGQEGELVIDLTLANR